MPQPGVQRGQAVLLHADNVKCRSLEMGRVAMEGFASIDCLLPSG